MEAETYKLRSKLHENDREYLIQTSNDTSRGSISTTVYVDGMRTDTYARPHPERMEQDQLLALVKQAHGDRKKELEGLLKAYRTAGAENDTDEMFRLAAALRHKRLFREAADLLRAVINLDPTHHPAWDELSRTALALGEADEAVEAARQAIEMQPGYADYRNHAGEAYLAAGMAEEAIAELEAAIHISMYFGDAYFNLGLAHTLMARDHSERSQILISVGRVQEYLQKAGMIYPEYLAYRDYQQGVQALESHDFSRALSLLKGVAEARQELRRQEFITVNRRLIAPPEAWTAEGIAEQIKALQAELEKHPNYLDVHSELVRCYLEQAGLIWDRGLEECQRIHDKHPKNEKIAEILEASLDIRACMLETLEKITPKG